MTGVSRKERHPERFFEHPPLIHMIMLAKQHTLIAGIHHESIIRLFAVVKIIQQASYIVINSCNTPEIVLQIFLISCVCHLFIGHTGCIEFTAWPPVILHPANAVPDLILR